MLLKRPVGPFGKFRLARLSKRAVIGFLFLAVVGAFYSHRNHEQIGNSISKQSRIAVNLLKSFSSTPKKVYINIKHKDYMKLSFKRQQALERGVLVTAHDDFVPVTINSGERQVAAKIRLKGDVTDHLTTTKWSYRVKVKGDDTLFGMKRFSLQNPRARSYVDEWFLHKTIAREGLIALRYGFIEMFMNGKRHGIYAFEEHFDKRLIENNRRREGPIIFFSEKADSERYPRSLIGGPRVDIYGSQVDVFRSRTTFENETLRQQFLVARNLLESFRNGKMQTCDVFDCQKLAKYLALLDLFGARHAAKYGNFKLYYNPVTSLLEPITFDSEQKSASAEARWSGVLAEDWYKWKELEPFHLLFRDLRLFRAYLDEVGVYTEPVFLDTLFTELAEELELNLKIIYRDTPRYKFSKEYFHNRRKFIRDALSPPVGIIPYFKGIVERPEGRYLEIEVGNMVTFPLNIHKLIVNGTAISAVDKASSLIKPSLQGEPVNVQTVMFPLPDAIKEPDVWAKPLRISFTTWSNGQPIERNVLPWPLLSAKLGINDLSRSVSDLDALPFIAIDKVERIIRILPGRWRITQELILPHGYVVKAGEGVELDLAGNGMIISYSPLQFIGTAKNPVIVKSLDQSTGGLAVIKTVGKSIFRNVGFKNLRSNSHSGWALTGAVTFYESPVEIIDSEFLGSRSEDALNIIRSKFILNGVHFEDAFSDALDLDFSSGRIVGSSFLNSGNDAIDLSGSVVIAQNLVINGAGDKGISIGEKSVLNAESLSIQNAIIGIASKDLSELTGKNVSITGAKVAIAVYQKKSEFGPSKGKIINGKVLETETLFLVEKGSSLRFNSQSVKVDARKISEVLNVTPAKK